MSTLSIFVDESGNFNMDDDNGSLYSIAFVFHNQQNIISQAEYNLDMQLDLLGYNSTFVHTAPIIRGKDEYSGLDRKTRQSIFNRFMKFLNSIPYTYQFWIYDKRNYNSEYILLNKMRLDIGNFINSSMIAFSRFDDILVYYDDGQKSIGDLLKSIFNTTFSAYAKFWHIQQQDYKLAQAADLICTFETIDYKWKNDLITKSEIYFFRNYKTFKTNFLSQIKRHRIIN